eukprot:GHVN01046229.1.p2 GENE.GHVN01046229.1~~GHVN01046229.1.p2  ORF type:complete len:106 (-),score=14.24 GHVN01046229.1:338-655(-)
MLIQQVGGSMPIIQRHLEHIFQNKYGYLPYESEQDIHPAEQRVAADVAGTEEVKQMSAASDSAWADESAESTARYAGMSATTRSAALDSALLTTASSERKKIPKQ